MSRSDKGTVFLGGQIRVVPYEGGRIRRGHAESPAFIYSARSDSRSVIGRHLTAF